MQNKSVIFFNVFSIDFEQNALIINLINTFLSVAIWNNNFHTAYLHRIKRKGGSEMSTKKFKESCQSG